MESTKNMPGCLSYIISMDATDANTIWITETWDSVEKHLASLQLPSVQEAISRGGPMIKGLERVATTEPVGGQGL